MVSFSKALISIATFTVANGYAIPNLTARDGKFLKLDFNVSQGVKGSSVLAARDSTNAGPFNVSLENHYYYYTTELLVGSQKDAVSVAIDTGSSDLFFPSVNATTGYADTAASIHSTGDFDDTKSTSLKNSNSPFFITFAEGSFAFGNYVQDYVSVSGGPSVNVEFGHAVVLTAPPILGIGLVNDESGESYPNYPQALKNNGIISKVAYSLYLSTPDATTGSLLFGGIDTEKFKGPLTTIPLTADNPRARLQIDLDAVSVGGKSAKVGLPVVLDSGTSYTYLPGDSLQTVHAAIPGSNTDAGYKVDNPDQYTNSNISISYSFQNQTINVPVSTLIVDAYNGDTKLDYKVLSVKQGADTLGILGDNFLRLAYVVFDLEDQEISLAPVKYTNATNIISIN